MDRSEIEREARKLLGAPWKEDGRDPAEGIDCMGLVLLSVWRATGIRLPDIVGNQRFNGWRKYLEKGSPEVILPGDLVLSSDGGSVVDHVAIVARDCKSCWNAIERHGVARTRLDRLDVRGYHRFKA